MAALYDTRWNLTGKGDPVQLPAQAVTPNLFPLLGIRALVGRTFSPDEGQPGHSRVVLLGYSLWQQRFGADPSVVGQAVQLDGEAYTVVGVMPSGFELFVKQGSLTGERAQLWVPIAFTAQSRIPRGRYMTAVARLKPGVTLAQAQAQMDALALQLQQEFKDFDTGWGVSLLPLHNQFSGELRRPLLVLFGAVAFVLLIACANVANLLLSRAATRRKEIAIRTALGAGRWRIVRQMLTESVVLGIAGGALGLLLANWGVDLLLSLSPKDLVGMSSVHLDWRVLVFTLAVSVFTGLLFGLAPAWSAVRSTIGETLKESGRSAGADARGFHLRNLFVVAEMSLALVLLAGSGLLIRSFQRLTAVDPGFDPKNLLTLDVMLPGAKYSEEKQRLVFFRQLLERISSLPGVQSASAINFLPFRGLGAATNMVLVGRPAPPVGQEPVTDVRVIEPGYFHTMGIPLLRGRLFTERESAEMSHVVIINQTMARQHWPDADPIGQKIIVYMKNENLPCEIVGVVGDVKHVGLDSTPRAMVYWPHPELVYPFMTLVIRSAGEPLSLVSAVQGEVLRMDKDQPIAKVATMEDLLSRSVSQARFNTFLLAVFAALALVLTSVGIYGVLSYAVTERTHEIGVRMALGAQDHNILGLIIGRGMRLAGIGVAIGLAGSFWLGRALTGLLFGVRPQDPLTFVTVAILLAGVALLACYIPARRALRVDPMVALRYE